MLGRAQFITADFARRVNVPFITLDFLGAQVVTNGRTFFSELNAKPLLPESLSAVSNRFGEWGEIYAGLLTGRLPAEFPLQQPTKLMENLYVLINPAMPPPRGK